LRRDEHFSTWVMQIARNLCASFVREQKVAQRGIRKLTVRADPDPGIHAQLQWALARLPQGYRLPLVLYYLDQRSIGSIAEILGTSETAVCARLCRARRKLRELLDAE
jgi:RNA polymerase sigma-70 factor (ECF subfamily)